MSLPKIALAGTAALALSLSLGACSLSINGSGSDDSGSPAAVLHLVEQARAVLDGVFREVEKEAGGPGEQRGVGEQGGDQPGGVQDVAEQLTLLREVDGLRARARDQ